METGQSRSIKLSARDLLTTLSERRITITEIKFAGNSSKDGGTYADVAVATLVRANNGREEERTVAVKKLRFILSGDTTEEKFLRVFVNELRVLDKLSHPNIVEIIGFVEDTENRIAWLVFPWEDNGNLREFLRSGKWELPERVSLIQDVACGLEYLHTRQPPICHGDLKSLNILVKSDHCAIISDFGSARIIRQIQELDPNPATHPTASASRIPPRNDGRLQFDLTASATTLTLTGPECSFRWAPPDVLNGGPLDLASDVWALGWVTWEGITGRYPFEEVNLESAVIMRIITGQLPVLHDHDQLSQIRSLCSMMLSCWKSEPSERPSATDCWRTLHWMPSVVPESKDGKQSTIRSAMIFLQLGEIHRLQDRHEEATKMYEQGLAIARSTRDQSGIARLSVHLAESQRFRGMYDEAEAAYTQARAIFESIGDDRGRADALRGLGYIQRVRFDYGDAEASFTQAMAIDESIGNHQGRANALLGLGHVQQARCDYGDAEASFTQAITIYASIGDDVGRANALLGLGGVQRVRHNHHDAQASFAQAMAIFVNIGDVQGQAQALAELGDVQEACSNYVDAEESYTQAMTIFGSIGDDLGRADALRGLGHIQRVRSNYIDAEASFTQATDIYGSIGHDQGRANALLGLGDVQKVRSNFLDAEASFTEAAAIYESVGNEQGRASALVGLGDVQKARSNYAHAEGSYSQAMVIFASIGDDLGRANALLGLGDVQRLSSKDVDAEPSYTQAMSLYASVNDDLGRTNSSLALSRIRLHQARYSEAKALINDAATISERINYVLGKRLSSEFLEDVLEAERSSAEPPPALPDMTRAEDIVAAPLSPQGTDTNTSDSVVPPQ